MTDLAGKRLAMVMDPLAGIKARKDTSLAILLAAQRCGARLFTLDTADLLLRDGAVYGVCTRVRVHDDHRHWFDVLATETRALTDFDVILMRKDPPFDLEFLYATHLLEIAERAGVPVVNKPRALRDHNEKLAIAQFPQCAPPTLVSRDPARLSAFIDEQAKAVIKPLDGMGGAGVFVVAAGDPNRRSILETLGRNGAQSLMAQRYLPQIRDGDKRIVLVDGVPAPWALARIPARGETRGNLAAGGRGEPVPLSERDRWICAHIAPALRAADLLFVGIDVIGDYLTEINVTSPTGVRELDAACNLDIAGDLMACIAERLTIA